MLKKCISKDWRFDDGQNGYQTIDLPHDYMIGKKRSLHCNGTASNGFWPDERGIYVKYLNFEQNLHYILDVDGAYMCSEVFLNENHITSHPHGYTPFLTDLTSWLVPECTNKLQIITNPLPRSTRWYSGNGIYRDVFLWEGGDIRIEPWDLFIFTEKADEKQAQMKVRCKVAADRAARVKIRYYVMKNDSCVCVDEVILDVKENEKTENVHTLLIEAPCLWSPETPRLYTLKTEIYEEGILQDTSFDDFGIRTVTADAQNGLLLNGKPLKLRGGCIHHDHGVLGAAAFPAAEMRKISRLKETGFNAVRTAHNPPSLALLECCDKLGILVMDEAFDCWNKGKEPNDYHLFFADWCMRDIACMVMRDRNHPCVISYSMGNEILEIDGTSHAAKWAKKLAEEIRRYDETRFVTSGIQKIFTLHNAEEDDPEDYKAYMKKSFGHETPEKINEITASYEEPLDIIGCNYYYQNYEKDHKRWPQKVIWGSETHAITFYDSWKCVKENPYIIGDFTWTAYDNLGEAGTGRALWERDGRIDGISLADYPWRSCYQGDHDLCGYRRPQSYFREAVWLGNTQPRIFVTHPEHFGEGFTGTQWHWYDVHESWTFDDSYIGKPVKADVYTDADYIEWFVNGKKIGQSVPQKAIASIETVYEKGKITAVAYKENTECGRYTLETTNEAELITVVAEKPTVAADNRDLAFFQISIQDSCGRLVEAAQNELICTVEGGELMGIYSGDPCNEDQYTSDRCHAFCGRALAVVRTKQPGIVSVCVCADGLRAVKAQILAE